MLGDEYLEMIPSVKPITASSSGTFIPNFAACFMAVTAKSSFTAKLHQAFFLLVN